MSVRTSFSFVSNRFVLLLLVGSLSFLGFSQYKQWQQRQKINAQIRSLKEEANAVEEKNKQLEDSLQYLSSSGASERLARQQMNMKKEGEIPVVFVPNQSSESSTVAEPKLKNWQLWWNYFFKQQ